MSQIIKKKEEETELSLHAVREENGQIITSNLLQTTIPFSENALSLVIRCMDLFDHSTTHPDILYNSFFLD